MQTADVATVTADTFDASVLDGDGPIAVEFMSYGCSHCRTLEPIIRQAASELAGTVRFFRVNVGVDGELAAAYDVRGTPTLVMFLDGNEVGRDAGTHPALASVTSAVLSPFRRAPAFR